MKTALVLTLLAAQPALAEIPRACKTKAESATEKIAEKDYYDEDGFWAFNCEIAPNNKAVICDVAAKKGGDAATDTYRVVLSRDCKRTYRVELIGEE